MLKIIKSQLIKLFSSLGYNIQKKEMGIFPSMPGNWLVKMNINTIIDIGANEGQFIQSISSYLPGRKIFAFEPIKLCFDQLVKNTKHLNVIPFNCGLSDHEGTSEINISKNFVSSSILPINNLTTNLYPDSKYVEKQTISLRRLDDVMVGTEFSNNALLKIDVQGYEEKVLSGSIQTLKRISVTIIEFSYQPLYENQWLFDETYEFFKKNGFIFAGVADQILSKNNGIPLYGDAIFIRKDLLDLVYK